MNQRNHDQTPSSTINLRTYIKIIKILIASIALIVTSIGCTVGGAAIGMMTDSNKSLRTYSVTHLDGPTGLEKEQLIDVYLQNGLIVSGLYESEEQSSHDHPNNFLLMTNLEDNKILKIKTDQIVKIVSLKKYREFGTIKKGNLIDVHCLDGNIINGRFRWMEVSFHETPKYMLFVKQKDGNLLVKIDAESIEKLEVLKEKKNNWFIGAIIGVVIDAGFVVAYAVSGVGY